MTLDYSYNDYEKAFLVILQAMVQRSGINMADEGHYRTVVSNGSELAAVAANHLRIKRQELRQSGKTVTADPGGVL